MEPFLKTSLSSFLQINSAHRQCWLRWGETQMIRIWCKCRMRWSFSNIFWTLFLCWNCSSVKFRPFAARSNELLHLHADAALSRLASAFRFWPLFFAHVENRLEIWNVFAWCIPHQQLATVLHDAMDAFRPKSSPTKAPKCESICVFPKFNFGFQ